MTGMTARKKVETRMSYSGRLRDHPVTLLCQPCASHTTEPEPPHPFVENTSATVRRALQKQVFDQASETQLTDLMLLTAARIETIQSNKYKSTATDYFLERDDRLFLATSRHRHVFCYEPTGHAPTQSSSIFTSARPILPTTAPMRSPSWTRPAAPAGDTGPTAPEKSTSRSSNWSAPDYQRIWSMRRLRQTTCSHRSRRITGLKLAQVSGPSGSRKALTTPCTKFQWSDTPPSPHRSDSASRASVTS